MMFILRLADGAAPPPGLTAKLQRRTPGSAESMDHFCVGEAAAIAVLREAGLAVVELRDGWYADDAGGGVAIWGQGRYWEVRDTPFTVREASGPASPPAEPGERDLVDVRRAIFGV